MTNDDVHGHTNNNICGERLLGNGNIQTLGSGRQQAAVKEEDGRRKHHGHNINKYKTT